MTFFPKMLNIFTHFYGEKKKVTRKRNASLMFLFVIHLEQCTNKITVFWDVMLYGSAGSSPLPPSLG